MKRLRLMILMIMTCWIATACSDFLEEKSQDEVIPSTVTDFREILLYYEQAAFNMPILMMDDDIMLDNSMMEMLGGSSTLLMIYEYFTWQPDMWEVEYTFSNEYARIYEQIKGINAVLNGIDDAEGSVEEKEIVKAQALGTRAYYYFILVNMYGEPYNYNKKALGIVLKLDVAYSEEGMSRSTVEEVYTRIVEDLETASVLLNKYPKTRGDYLINSTAVDILLSRVYLYMEEYEKVIIAADRAINTAEGLFDYKTLPVGDQFYMTTYDNSEVEWLFSKVEMPGFMLIIPSDDLLSKFDVNDRRQELLELILKISPLNAGANVMIRSPEAYLNRAEAKVLAVNPDLVGALEDLNELRRYRIKNYSDVDITDAETLLNEIREERRKEFCFEGHRWFDLRRYGMPSISHDMKLEADDPLLRYTLREKDPLYTLPIPRVILENNTGMEQNQSAFEPERVGLPID